LEELGIWGSEKEEKEPHDKFVEKGGRYRRSIAVALPSLLPLPPSSFGRIGESSISFPLDSWYAFLTRLVAEASGITDPLPSSFFLRKEGKCDEKEREKAQKELHANGRCC